MKIKSIDMINFGKFTNYHIDFEDEFNLIYGLNESGKSTIHSFIAFMLFGVNKENTKRKTKIRDYLRFKPLNKNEYNGKLVFEKDGAAYEIYRDFLNDTYYVSKNGLDITESIKNETAKDNKSIGEIIFGLTRNVFLTSSYISQSKDIYFDDFDDIKDLLFKLKSNDEESFTFNDAANNIASELSYIGTENAKTKELYRLKNEINSLDRDISNAENTLEDTMSILNRKKDLQNMKHNLESKAKDFDVFRKNARDYYKKENQARINELEKKKEALLSKTHDISTDDYQRFKDINRYLESVKASAARDKIFNVISLISLLLAILLGVYNFLRKDSISLYIAIVFTILFVFCTLLGKKKSKANSDVNAMQKEKEKILAKYSMIDDESFENSYINATREDVNKKYISSMDDFIKSYTEKDFDDLSDEKVVDYLSRENHEAYESFAQFSRKKNDDDIIKLNLELKEIETKLSYNDKVLQRVYELEYRKEALEERRQELERRKMALKSAYDILLSLNDEINISYMPKIIKQANKYIAMFSSDKYKFFLLDDNFKVMLRNTKTELVYEEENLSRQVLSMSYLSLRLALIDVLSIELPLIFDENLAYFDKQRLAIAVDILHSLSKEKQVLLFTSSKDEKSVLSEHNLCYNYIQL